MKKVYSRPKSLKPAHFHYCPGCGHAIVNIAEGKTLKRVGLAHMSAECNNPIWARTIVGSWLKSANLNLDITVLEQEKVTRIYGS